jgi:hypothetical protein
MKKRLLLSAVVLGVVGIAVLAWTLEAIALAFRPARLAQRAS